MHAGATSDLDDKSSLPDEAPQSAGQKRRKGSRVLLNFILDAGLLLAVALMVWISVLMQVVFPVPTLAGGWELWGLSFNQWRDLQFYTLCLCALLALEHLVLHWNWVCSVIATKMLRTKSRPHEGLQAIYGIGFFISIMLAVMATLIVAILTVKRPPS
jgi:hypothetical protein